MNMLTVRANAKINLYLDVLSRRENGYHNIYSLMQTVSLCDLISVEYRPEEHTSIQLQGSGNDRMPLDCRNLAWRAAELFLQKVQRKGAVLIRIEKHIPMEAGLAGGSTDAAAVLRALNRLCGSPLSIEELCDLGSKLGADVPFCIVGGCAITEGIGEKLTSNEPLSQCSLVVACMGEGVSTPWAYGVLDQRYDGFTAHRSVDAGVHLAKMLEEKASAETLCQSFYNIFEEAVEPERAAVSTLKATMENFGAIRSMMSGSGPSVFGIFRSESEASGACERIKQMGGAAFVCRPTVAYSEK